MNNKIYVGNLNYNTSEDDLRNTFSEYGTIESVNIITDRFSGQSKGFGFIEMGDADEAKRAIDAMDQQELGGRSLKVNEAKEKSHNDRRNF
jgi:RNA recognition motif-containing protein